MMDEKSYHRIVIAGNTQNRIGVREIAPAEIRIADSKESAIEAIRQGVQDWRSSVHVILTGSAQDYYLGTALSLFGREQDRLYDQNMAPLPFVPLRGYLPQSFHRAVQAPVGEWFTGTHYNCLRRYFVPRLHRMDQKVLMGPTYSGRPERIC
jgi:hypothetical protein